MTDSITLYNNRLGNLTLAPPRDMPPGARAVLKLQLRLPPGGSVTLARDVWEAMAANPGNAAYVLSGELSTRRENVARRTPPTSLDKLDRTELSAPRGVGDFVHGLRADPALVRDVERARRNVRGADTRMAVTRAAIDASTASRSALDVAAPGDYAGLLRALAAQGVNLDTLREQAERMALTPEHPLDSSPAAPEAVHATAPEHPLDGGASSSEAHKPADSSSGPRAVSGSEPATPGERSGNRKR